MRGSVEEHTQQLKVLEEMVPNSYVTLISLVIHLYSPFMPPFELATLTPGGEKEPHPTFILVHNYT